VGDGGLPVAFGQRSRFGRRFVVYVGDEVEELAEAVEM